MSNIHSRIHSILLFEIFVAQTMFNLDTEEYIIARFLSKGSLNSCDFENHCAAEKGSSTHENRNFVCFRGMHGYLVLAQNETFNILQNILYQNVIYFHPH